MPIIRRIVACLVIAFATSAISQTKPADVVAIADFESGQINISVKSARAGTQVDSAAQRQKYLRIVPSAANAYVRLGVPDSTSFVDREHLSAELRVAAKADATLTWMALNDKQQPIFLRTIKLEPADVWSKIDLPLRHWRWPEGRVGDWDEVHAVALRIDSGGVDQIDLDNVQLERSASRDERVNWLLDPSFERNDRKQSQRDDFLIATDAVAAFREQDLHELLDDVGRARKFIRRVFGDAVRPTEQIGSPATLLIFSSDESRHEFFDRLGAAWGVKIQFGGAQGFTFHDIATATYVEKLGVRRPVYLHEAVHAIVSRDLRVPPGRDQRGVLSEAIANYIQICVHPKSIARDAYPKAFMQPIDGKGIFKPLETLLSGTVTSKDYAQLASLCAYLVEKDPELLRDLTSALADGGTVSDVLAKSGPTFAALQDAWLTWGRARFKNAPAEGEPIFERPIEFR